MPSLAGEKDPMPASQHEDSFSSSHVQLTECCLVQRPFTQEENWCYQWEGGLQNDISKHRGALVSYHSQREISRL